MSKEMFIAASPHETKVAVLEDDQLVEVFYERDTDVGLVGSIYKGRVNRVLPGMQSAFVDIGLERDAFLYVSDFFEDAEEYDRIVTEAEARVSRYDEKSAAAAPAERAQVEEPAAPQAPAEPTPQAAETRPLAPLAEGQPSASIPSEGSPSRPEATVIPAAASQGAERPQGPTPDFRRQDHRGRRRRRHGRPFGEYRSSKPEHRERPAEPTRSSGPETGHAFEILPGESLAKYRHQTSEAPPAERPDQLLRETSPAPTETVVDPYAAAPTPVPEARVENEPSPLPQPVEAATERVAPQESQPPAKPDSEGQPRPLWNRLVSSVFGEPANTTAPQTAPTPERTPPSEVSTAPFREETAPAEEAPPSVPEQTPQGAATAGVGLQTGSAPAFEPAPTGHATGAPSASSGSPGEPAERQYTLREPHQRPRFAPRRGRRGRRGQGPRDFRRDGAPRQELRPGNHQPAQISELLKEGKEILVQIAKEPLGRKGARITSHIALPGRYLVYMPTVDHIGVSRKIASEEERLRLRNVIVENKGAIPGGLIVRTAGAGQPAEELIADMKFLSSLWNSIKSKAETAKAPDLLHSDLDLVQRLLRDFLSPEFKSVWVDNETQYERAVEFANRRQPSLVGRVKLYTREAPLFEEFSIQPEIEKALKPKVWLKSGGYIVINQTEALVAIDVNTGKFVGKTNRLEDTIVKTNIDAVNEIVRQIRLRDLGGIIVIDFIDMDERRNRNKVVQALEEALRHDRAPTKLLAFNDFGLVAITRKRVKQSLERTLCVPCQYCTGSGWVKSVVTVCHEILAEARKMARQLEGDAITLRVNPEVARALKSREGVALSELESILHKNVIIKSDPTVHQERFEIY